MSFNIKRHNDHTYEPPAPWNHWDDYANCWCCNECGAAAGYGVHSPICSHGEEFWARLRGEQK